MSELIAVGITIWLGLFAISVELRRIRKVLEGSEESDSE